MRSIPEPDRPQKWTKRRLTEEFSRAPFTKGDFKTIVGNPTLGLGKEAWHFQVNSRHTYTETPISVEASRLRSLTA